MVSALAAELRMAENVTSPVFILGHARRELGIDLAKEFEPRPDGKIRENHLPMFALASKPGKHVLQGLVR